MKLGTLLETIFKYTGIKWLVKKIVIDYLGYENCGCEKRKNKEEAQLFKGDSNE